MKKYYSFYVGLPKSLKSEWVLLDDKIPAFNPFQAIVFHYWISHNKDFVRCRVPSSLSISNYYRMLVEFERVEPSHKGFTIAQFHQTRFIYSHDFLKMFK
ncbi:MAG: hypothetical protein JNL70_04840 [Saprospiraceae bacterium]|nr:hypothetical protein [Saprospiraceae bacterium]